MYKFKSLLGVTLALLLLSACGPPKTDKYVDIKSYETAFVIPLESPEKQKQSMSIEFIKKMQVHEQRIYLAQKKVITGRWWFSYDWIPDVKVITVTRQPIRLLWEGPQAIPVESKDSINFTVGIDTTAHVATEDTALFLYNFPSGDLRSILNDSVKSASAELLSNKFAQYDLAAKPEKLDKDGKVIAKAVPGAREQKGEIVAEAKVELAKYFKELGVTIDTFGLVGGLHYENDKIQAAINENFKSNLEVENQHNAFLAQKETNEKIISIAVTARKSAEEFAKAKDAQIAQVALDIQKLNAEANLVKAQRWSGNLPSNIMPDGAGFIVDTKSGK